MSPVEPPMSEMTPAEALFFAAAALPAADRAGYLLRACAGNEELRIRVERMLAVQPEVGDFLEPARASADGPTGTFAAGDPTAAPGGDTADFPGKDEHVGAILGGKYKLIEEIGEGGMGSVYMAQQTEPVKRAVAVKVIKAGMDSKAVLARFEAERQALAMMDHPNIAKVLDAGTTESGRPYFVMELVKGVPITQFCDERKLTPKQRLELFVPVCKAIQHAHMKGVIHRDIKPSNVLVALYDDRPVPKVIDFGVAKATGQTLTDKTLMTGFGAVLGTPEYMSPEQASLNNLDIDTRSDVYSLGVLLYELLTGTTPVDRKSLGQAALLEVLRIVREVEAPRPSDKLSTSDELPSISANRGTEPAKLSKLMKGELDWVLLKALEKDRTRRYGTANGLARDIQRHLADEVVEARPPSAGYRLKKFVKRHKGRVIAASLVVLALIAGMVGTSWQAIRATQAERDAVVHAQLARDGEATAAANEQRALAAGEKLRRKNYVSTIHRIHAAWEANDLRPLALLDDMLARPGEEDLRGFEWHYLNRLRHTGVLTLQGKRFDHVAFSPDGLRLVAAVNLAGKNELQLMDAATGKELLSFKGHASHIWSVAISPDGKRLASASNEVVKVWDAVTGREVFALPPEDREQVLSVAFSPDSRLLATSGRTVKVWDAATGQKTLALTAPNEDATFVTFSPDGKRLVSASRDGTVTLWELPGGRESLTLSARGTSGAAVVAAFSPDGKYLATSIADTCVRIWDLSTAKQVYTLNGHTSTITSLTFSPEGNRLASAGGDHTVRVWGLGTGRELFSLNGHASHILSVAFSPDGTRLASTSCYELKVWDATGPQGSRTVRVPLPSAACAALSPDGTRLALGTDHYKDRRLPYEVKVLDTTTGRAVHVLTGHTHEATSVVFSPDGRRLASAGIDIVKQIPSPAVAGLERTVRVWETTAGKELFVLKWPKKRVDCLAFSPDGRRLVTAGEETQVWDVESGKELPFSAGHTGAISAVAFSPDGDRLASAGDDKTVKVWDLASGRETLSFKQQARKVRRLVFSPDGKRLVTVGGDRDARDDPPAVTVWDAITGKECLSLPDADPGSVAYSPDGKRLAGVAASLVKIWDAMSGEELITLKTDSGWIHSIAFSRDGRHLVVVGGDGMVKAWDATPRPDELPK